MYRLLDPNRILQTFSCSLCSSTQTFAQYHSKSAVLFNQSIRSCRLVSSTGLNIVLTLWNWEMRRIVSPNKEIGEVSRYSQLSLKQQTSFIANQSFFQSIIILLIKSSNLEHNYTCKACKTCYYTCKASIII